MIKIDKYKKLLRTIITIFIFLTGFNYGCCTPETEKIAQAKDLIKSGKAECVLISNNSIFAQERGHGVSPLLNIYDQWRKEMAGGVIVDKVIGRAAATIAICGKVRHVHGELMSEDAISYLQDNGVSYSYTQLVPRILNRKMDGLCPLEKSVYGISDPQKALISLRKKIDSFAKLVK